MQVSVCKPLYASIYVIEHALYSCMLFAVLPNLHNVNLTGTRSRHLTRDNIREIEPLLREIESPLMLGLQLDIPIDVLKDIEKEHTGNKRQMIEVIDYWLKNYTKCTWGTLAEAVKRVGGHDNLAHKLNQKDSVSAEPVIESMEMECGDPVEPMMVSVPIRRTRGDSSRTRHPEKYIGATKSCPNFLVSGKKNNTLLC